MTDQTGTFPGPEQWMKYWQEMMQASGMAPQPQAMPSPADFARRMQEGFLDMWARHLDEFMRSETFMNMMKQSMESALRFRQQMDELMQKALESSGQASRRDTDDIMQFLHSFEDRVLDQLQNLTRRVDAIEKASGNGSPAGTSRPAAKGGAKR